MTNLNLNTLEVGNLVKKPVGGGWKFGRVEVRRAGGQLAIEWADLSRDSLFWGAELNPTLANLEMADIHPMTAADAVFGRPVHDQYGFAGLVHIEADPSLGFIFCGGRVIGWVMAVTSNGEFCFAHVSDDNGVFNFAIPG